MGEVDLKSSTTNKVVKVNQVKINKKTHKARSNTKNHQAKSSSRKEIQLSQTFQTQLAIKNLNPLTKMTQNNRTTKNA